MGNKAHEAIPGNPATATSSRKKLNKIFASKGQPLELLSEADWKHWIEEGYVILKGAIPLSRARRTADLIRSFEGVTQQSEQPGAAPPRAEMQMKELAGTGMVELYDHQYLWDNRQEERIHKAFADIWETEELWVTIDRANLNFPSRPGYGQKGFIHWDYDPETKPQNVQGVLALSDQTDPEMGGFQCIPWLYRNYDQWKQDQPAGRDLFNPTLRVWKTNWSK